MAKLTKRAVDALNPQAKAYVAYDSELPGFDNDVAAQCVNHPNRHTWINHAKRIFDHRAALVYFRQTRLSSD